MNTPSSTRRSTISYVWLAGVLLAGCAAEALEHDDEWSQPAGPAEEARAPDIGSKEQALPVGPTRLHATGTFSRIGPLWEEDKEWVFGGDCSLGSERSPPSPTATRASATGFGWCAFSHWANPGNPHDCRAVIRTHTNAFWGGIDCTYFIFEQNSTRTCGAAGERCGTSSSSGECWCDSACTNYGDCCRDYSSVCH